MAAQKAVAADTLIDGLVAGSLGFAWFQALLGSSCHPRAAEPWAIAPFVIADKKPGFFEKPGFFTSPHSFGSAWAAIP